MSSPVAQRPTGMRAEISANRFSSSRRGAVSSVSTQPGATAFTRIPSGAHSFACAFMSCAMAPFEAA